MVYYKGLIVPKKSIKFMNINNEKIKRIGELQWI